jgi:hypothetical protein
VHVDHGRWRVCVVDDATVDRAFSRIRNDEVAAPNIKCVEFSVPLVAEHFGFAGGFHVGAGVAVAYDKRSTHFAVGFNTDLKSRAGDRMKSVVEAQHHVREREGFVRFNVDNIKHVIKQRCGVVHVGIEDGQLTTHDLCVFPRDEERQPLA